MAEKREKKPGALAKALKLFGLIFLVLLVPVVLDQVDVDGETIKVVGRVAAGLTVVLLLYGIVTKVFRILAVIVIALIALVVLMAEDQMSFPKLREFFSEKAG